MINERYPCRKLMRILLRNTARPSYETIDKDELGEHWCQKEKSKEISQKNHRTKNVKLERFSTLDILIFIYSNSIY